MRRLPLFLVLLPLLAACTAAPADPSAAGGAASAAPNTSSASSALASKELTWEEQQALNAVEIRRLTTHPVDVTADPSVLTAIAHPEYNERCPGQEDPGMKPLPSVLVPPKRLDDRISVRMRLADPTKDRAVGYREIYDGMPMFEFVGADDSVVVPPPLPGWSCPFSSKEGADVYYFRPDRILVDLGQGHESADALFLWDGKEWRDLYRMMPTLNPLELGAVARDRFVVRETAGCCDVYSPTLPEGWSRFVVDADTLAIVDAWQEQEADAR